MDHLGHYSICSLEMFGNQSDWDSSVRSETHWDRVWSIYESIDPQHWRSYFGKHEVPMVPFPLSLSQGIGEVGVTKAFVPTSRVW